MDGVWKEFEGLARASRNDVVIRPARAEDGSRTLTALGVTTGSALGTFALHTEITQIDHGWLRLLGAGGTETRCGLLGLDGEGLPLDPAEGFVVAYDVVGGFFAIDGGGLGGGQGEVHYLAPDTLAWEGTELGHGDWVRWTFTADLDQYYRDLRWSGWSHEVRQVGTDQVLHLYPPPFTEQGADISAVSRRPVPVHESWSVAQEFRRQLGPG